MSKQSEKLLDQIIEFAEIQDTRFQSESIKDNQGEKAVGQDWMIHHLKLLKQALKEKG